MTEEKLKLYSKEKLIDIIEKLSIEFAIKNQQYEYIRHNDYSNELQQIIEKATNKVQDIIDIGFDYDGYNDVDNLKILVDELVDLARQTKNILNGSDE